MKYYVYVVFERKGITSDEQRGVFDNLKDAIKKANSEEGAEIRIFKNDDISGDYDIIEIPYYTINDIDKVGGFDSTRYTWFEVLDWFGAPQEIENIEDLTQWIELRDGIRCQYIIERF